MSFLLFPGFTVFLPADTEAIIDTGDGEVYGFTIFFPIKRCADLPQKFRVMPMTALMAALCEEVLSWGDFETKAVGKTPAQKRLADVLIDQITGASQTFSLQVKVPIDPVLRRVADAILKNPGDGNNIDYWARRAQMSRRSFTMNFNKETGMSFIQWRNLVRVNAALKLLAEGKRTKEVAHRLGFSTPSLFIRTFQQYTKESPGRFGDARKLKEKDLTGE